MSRRNTHDLRAKSNATVEELDASYLRGLRNEMVIKAMSLEKNPRRHERAISLRRTVEAIDRALAALSEKLPTGTTPETQEDDLPCGIRDGCHNCANRVGETCTVQGDPMPISSDGGIECPLQCVLPPGALPEALTQQEQDARNLDAVGPAREAPSACTNCGHEEIHHNSPVANGRCEGEFERCGCSKFHAPAPSADGEEIKP